MVCFTAATGKDDAATSFNSSAELPSSSVRLGLSRSNTSFYRVFKLLEVC